MQTYFRSKITNIGSSPFLILKYVPPLDPANPLYFILIWYIDTTYVSGKLGPGGEHTSKLKMVMTLFSKYLTGNKFALIDICMICMCNKIKIKAS